MGDTGKAGAWCSSTVTPPSWTKGCCQGRWSNPWNLLYLICFSLSFSLSCSSLFSCSQCGSWCQAALFFSLWGLKLVSVYRRCRCLSRKYLRLLNTFRNFWSHFHNSNWLRWFKFLLLKILLLHQILFYKWLRWIQLLNFMKRASGSQRQLSSIPVSLLEERWWRQKRSLADWLLRVAGAGKTEGTLRARRARG